MKSLVRGLELSSLVENPILKQKTSVPDGLFSCRLTVAGRPCRVTPKTEYEPQNKKIVMQILTTNGLNSIS